MSKCKMKKLGFYGCGNMGGAILRNVVEQEICSGGEVLVVDRAGDAERFKSKRLGPARLGSERPARSKKLEQISEHLGVETSVDPADLSDCEFVILGFKPQNLGEIPAFPDNPKQVIISILAGTTVENLRKKFSSQKIARAMPNLPLQYKNGMTGLLFPEEFEFSESEEKFVERLFSSGGITIDIENEADMNGFTVLCGSGPAYFLYLAEQMAGMAERIGYSPDQADVMMRQILSGAAAMEAHSGQMSLAELRERVTSKGGVTEAAVAVLEENKGVFEKMFEAGVKRGEELQSKPSSRTIHSQ